jgi:RHS repeat-associated protein
MRALTASDGSLTDGYTCTAFGEIAQQAGGDEQPYRFAGEEWEPSLVGYYLRARWYAPTAGRLLQKDRIEAFTEMPQFLNGYICTFNRPTDMTDPSGLFGLADVAATQAILGEPTRPLC